MAIKRAKDAGEPRPGCDLRLLLSPPQVPAPPPDIMDTGTFLALAAPAASGRAAQQPIVQHGRRSASAGALSYLNVRSPSVVATLKRCACAEVRARYAEGKCLSWLGGVRLCFLPLLWSHGSSPAASTLSRRRLTPPLRPDAHTLLSYQEVGHENDHVSPKSPNLSLGLDLAYFGECTLPNHAKKHLP